MIRRIAVADRGEAARRVFATCRAIGVETVAVYSEADSSSPHVTEADLAVRIEPAGRVDHGGPGEPVRIAVASVARSGADAIHPGYSPLAEDPGFAAEVQAKGLTWVGAPQRTLCAVRSKQGLRSLLARAGLPVLPIYPAEVRPAGQQPEPAIAYPILIKPAAGRGGHGMRMVRHPGGLGWALAAARDEALARFNDEAVICEQYVESARHVEVQVIADTAGTVVPLGERECSIQRRRQPIVEEAPSPAVDPGLRAELFAAAVTAARAVGLVGVATVEFLLDPAGDFFLLELSPRLSPAHQVTECVFGLDLVRLQLLVAEGGAIPFAAPPPMRGHAIGVRLVAEDPAYDWRSGDGAVTRFDMPGIAHRFGPLLVPGLRLDPVVDPSANPAGLIGDGAGDPVVGKIISWAPARREAARILATALARARLHGVTTNRDLLVRVLRSADFLAGEISTSFLDRHPEVYAPLLSSLDAVRLSCLAAALANAERSDHEPAAPRVVGYQGPTGALEVAYWFDRSRQLAGWSVSSLGRDEAKPTPPGPAERAGTDLVGAAQPKVRVVTSSRQRVDLEVDGVRLKFDIFQCAGDPVICYVDSPDGSVALRELPLRQESGQRASR